MATLKEIDSPAHYATGQIECIDAMVAAFGDDAVRTYAKVAAFKYLFRCQTKHESDEIDLRKARWYISWALGEDPRKEDK